MILYDALVRSKLAYSSVAGNAITLTGSSKLERIQRKLAALHYSRFFIGTCYNRYDDIPVRQKLSTLQSMPRFLDALFLNGVF
jgi:hypothetical protein